MSFSIDILKDARAELDMYQSLADHKLDDKEYEDKINDLNDAIKALESNNFNDSIHSVSDIPDVCPHCSSKNVDQNHCNNCDSIIW